MSERVKGHVSHAHLCMLNWANVYCRESFGKNKLWFFQTLILATGSKCCVGMLVFACQKKNWVSDKTIEQMLRWKKA